MSVTIKFFCGEHCLYNNLVTKHEFETTLMCVIHSADLDYPFMDSRCHKKYVQDFWNYFNIQQSYDITNTWVYL